MRPAPIPYAFEELEDSNCDGDRGDNQATEPEQQPHLPVLDLCLKLHLDFLNLGEEPQFRVLECWPAPVTRCP